MLPMRSVRNVTYAQRLCNSQSNQKVFISSFSLHTMKETFPMDVELPEFMNLVEAEAKKQILDEVANRIRKQVALLVEQTAREIIARKLDIYPSEVSSAKIAESQDIGEAPGGELEREEEPDLEMELKSTLAEEILSLPEEEALRKLKMSLAKGEIDERTFSELKALVEPVITSAVCPQCGKELEPTVNFCRFCGAKVK